jgi:hypothetical protein
VQKGSSIYGSTEQINDGASKPLRKRGFFYATAHSAITARPLGPNPTSTKCITQLHLENSTADQHSTNLSSEVRQLLKGNMTPLAKLLTEIRKQIPTADLIREETGEISILTGLVLDRDSLVPRQLSDYEIGVRQQITELLISEYVDCEESDFDSEDDLPALIWDSEEK